MSSLGKDQLMSGIEKKLDLTDKKVSKTVQEPRKPSFSEMQYKHKEKHSKRQCRENMSEITPSLSDLHIEPDARVYSDRRLELTQQRWEAKRNDSGVSPKPSDSQRYWQYRQGGEVKSRPDGRKFDTSKLGQLKGSGPGESSRQEETTKQQELRKRHFKEHTDVYK